MTRKRFLSRTEISNSAPEIDYSLYPSSWSKYIGQEQAKRMLAVAVKSAKVRKARMDHTLIAHPSPGVGKTALGALTARERGTTCRVWTGPMTADQARLLFSTMKDGDILFYDEIHRLFEGGRKAGEWILTFLQDGQIEGPFGMEPQPAITVIGATTDPQKLPPAVLSRFPLQPLLLDYDLEEATKIAQLMSASILGELEMPTMVTADARMVASAADCNPRAMRNLIVTIRDLHLIEELEMRGSRYDIKGALDVQGITEDGLTVDAQRYLQSLVVDFAGKGGKVNLQDRLQIAGGVNDVENLLMKRGFISKTGSGRQITAKGIARYNELMKEIAA